MKHIFLTALFLSAISTAICQVESFYLGENLKEKVKEKKIREIKGEMFKYANGVMEKTGKQVFYYSFDERGNSKKKMLFSFKKDKAVANYEFNYNEKDILTDDIEYDGAGHIAIKCKYIYDEKNRLIERIKCKPNGKHSSNILYRYNEESLLECEEWYNQKGTIYEEKKYAYDERGNLSEETHYNNFQSVITHFEYKYDINNLLIEKINYYADGNVYERWIYEYDLSGYRIQEHHYFSGDKPECTLNYIYGEDKLIKEVNLYVESGKISKTFKYTYTFN